MRRFFVAIALLIAIALLVYWLRHDGDQPLLSFPLNLSDEPDLLVHGVAHRQYRASGELNYEFRAAKVEHYEASERTLFSDLQVKLYSKNAEVWNAVAATGNVDGKQLVRLAGNVRLWREHGVEEVVEFRTAELTYYPDRDVLESKQPVTMTKGTSKIHADSLEIDLANNEFQLESIPGKQVQIELR